MKFKIVASLIIAVVLQTLLGTMWMRLTHHEHPLITYIDLPLVAITYFALRRDIVQSLFIGAGVGLATDALGGGLLGAGGFSNALTVYLIATVAIRFHLNTPLVRIPVLAGAAIINSAVYVFLQKVFDYPPAAPFVETIVYKVIATTIAGTFIFYLLDFIFSSEQNRQFAWRRRAARRRSFGR
ncbi:MAG: hypothetical protein NVSMB56_07610 [Pyrinomonadaceae bacterium]